MQSDWPPEHSQALNDYLARGMSFSEAARALNAKFGTAYSRSAAIGRAKRMEFAAPSDRPDDLSTPPPIATRPRLERPRERHIPEFMRPMPIWKRKKMPKLRCVEIDPRHLSLSDLEASDCRYPYGGGEEGEATTLFGPPPPHGSRYFGPPFYPAPGPPPRPEQAVAPLPPRPLSGALTPTGA